MKTSLAVASLCARVLRSAASTVSGHFRMIISDRNVVGQDDRTELGAVLRDHVFWMQ